MPKRTDSEITQAKEKRLDPAIKGAVIVAVIGLVGTVLAAVLPKLIDGSSTPPLAAPTALATPIPGPIPFASTDHPGALSPSLRWDAGQSALSSYALPLDAIDLVAGPSSWPGFPTIAYRLPLTGDFDVQVAIEFSASTPFLEDAAQGAGLVVRPSNARLVRGDETFPPDWIANVRAVSDAGQSIGCRGALSDYPHDVAYLRIERVNNGWRCAHSENGTNWIWSAPKVDEGALTDRAVEMALLAWSTNADPLQVRFKDWTNNSR